VGEDGTVYWRLIQEIPANVSALAGATGTGLFAITAAGAGALRTIAGTSGEINVADGDGVAGPPTLSLADVADSGSGTLQKTDFDAKGRKIGTAAATTDDLGEGASNQYYTDARADALIAAFEATLASLPDAADDAAAASASVPVGGRYRTGSTLKVRIS
jgi:hypothetical protein